MAHKTVWLYRIFWSTATIRTFHLSDSSLSRKHMISTATQCALHSCYCLKSKLKQSMCQIFLFLAKSERCLEQKSDSLGGILDHLNHRVNLKGEFLFVHLNSQDFWQFSIMYYKYLYSLYLWLTLSFNLSYFSLEVARLLFEWHILYTSFLQTIMGCADHGSNNQPWILICKQKLSCKQIQILW